MPVFPPSSHRGILRVPPHYRYLGPVTGAVYPYLRYENPLLGKGALRMGENLGPGRRDRKKAHVNNARCVADIRAIIGIPFVGKAARKRR